MATITWVDVPSFRLRAQTSSPQAADYTPVPLTPICDAGNTCLTPVNGPIFTVTGDAQGSGVNSGAAFLTSNDSALSTALATFSGTVSQCGSGTVLLRYTARYGAKVPGGGEGDWDYVEGTGTGDLAHINGGGTFRLSSTNDDLSATAAFAGRIRC